MVINWGDYMLKISEIKDVNHRNFKEAIMIYTKSFPPNERHSIDIIEKRVKENLYQMFIGRLKDKVVLMALLYPLKNTDFVLFDYIAVEKNYRSKGIGTKFIKYFLNILRKKNVKKYLIVEVENPKYGNNKEQRKRRIEFYKRLGAKEMKNVRYMLPPLSGNSPTEMILMILPEYNDGVMQGRLVKTIVIQIYKELYDRNDNDSLLNSFIYDIDSTVKLE